MKSDVAEEKSVISQRGRRARQLIDHTSPPCFSDLSSPIRGFLKVPSCERVNESAKKKSSKR